MTDDETAQTSEQVKDIAQRHSVIVVEHDMEFIKALGTRVTVQHESHVLAEENLEHVQNNEEVIDINLGR